MNIEKDTYRLVQSLVDCAPAKDGDTKTVTIENFYYSDRRIDNPFYYELEDTILTLEKKKHIKVIAIQENIEWQVTSMYKPIFNTYQVSYSLREIKKFLSKLKQKNKFQESSESNEDDFGKVEWPYCVEENGKGYLKFSKHGERIPISKADARPFLFLKETLNPEVRNAFLPVREVIKKIHIKSDENKRGRDMYTWDDSRIALLIKNSCIKQLQKDNKLRGKLTFEFNANGTHVKAVLKDT